MFKNKGGKEKPNKSQLGFLNEKEITQWTAHEVGMWLSSVGLDKYRNVFFYNEIDGEMLLDIDDDDLLALPIERLGDRKKILRKVNEVRGSRSGGGGSSASVKATASQSSAAGSETGGGSLNSDASGSDTGSSNISSKQFIEVKCVYNDDIRTIRIGKSEDYDTFKQKIRNEYNSSRVIAKYKDQDGDLVTIRNSKDLANIVQLIQGKVRVKLIIFQERSSGKKKKSSRSSKSKSSSSNNDDDNMAAEASIMENFMDAVVVANRRGVIQFFNAAAEDLFGWDREEVLGKNVTMLMNENDAKNHAKYLRRYRREGNPRVIGKGRQVVGKDRDNNKFDLWLSLSESNDTFTAILRKIESGERKLTAKTEISKVGELFAAFDDYYKPAICFNDDGIIQYCNKITYKTFGYDEGTLLGQSITMICPAVHSSEGDDLISDYRQKMASGAAKGKLLDANNQRDVVCYSHAGAVMAFLADFSSRVYENNSYYIVQLTSPDGPSGDSASPVLAAQRAVISSLVIPGIVINGEGIIQEMNITARQLFGYNLCQVLGRNVKMLIPPGEVKDNHQDWIVNYNKTGKSKNANGISLVVGKGRNVTGATSDNRRLKLNLSVTVLEEASGEKVFTGIFQCLGEDEPGIEESEILKQQIAVIEQLLIPSFVITHDSKIRGANEAGLQLFGFAKAQEVLMQDVTVLMPPGDIRKLHPQFIENFSSGKKKAADSIVVGKGRKVIARHRAGHNFSTTLSVTERRDGKVAIYTGVFS